MDIKIEVSLPSLSKSPQESYSNWMNRRKMCAGFAHEPYVEAWPFKQTDKNGVEWLIYPKFRVLASIPSLCPALPVEDEFIAIEP